MLSLSLSVSPSLLHCLRLRILPRTCRYKGLTNALQTDIKGFFALNVRAFGTGKNGKAQRDNSLSALASLNVDPRCKVWSDSVFITTTGIGSEGKVLHTASKLLNKTIQGM